MPFTFAHPAIILPLTDLPKRWFSLTALIVGSMAPDFEYFIRMRVETHYSHTLAGLVYFDLPLAIVIAFVCHNVVRDMLIDNLPVMVKLRLLPYKYFNWNTYFKHNWPVVVLSVIIGAASHLLWDSFTHQTGFFVNQINLLKDTVEVGTINLPVYKLLQHTSTLLGFALIGITVWRLKISEDNSSTPKYRYWITVIVIAVAVIAMRLLSGLDPASYGHLIVSCIAASLLAVVLTPMLIKKIKIE